MDKLYLSFTQIRKSSVFSPYPSPFLFQLQYSYEEHIEFSIQQPLILFITFNEDNNYL